MKRAKFAIFWSWPFYEAHQARDLIKHAKQANFLKRAKHVTLWSTLSTPIFWSTPITPFHEARQARKHAKLAST